MSAVVLDQIIQDEVEDGLARLAWVQSQVSANVPNALDGSRETLVHYAYALEEELHEVLRELPWKPWKTPQAPDRTRVIEEFADVLAFLGVITVNLAKQVGMTREEFSQAVAAQYAKTSMNNARRFTNGQETSLGHD